MEAGPAEVRAWVAAWAAETAAEQAVDEFVSYVDDAILARVPAIAADPVLTAELHASTRAQFRGFLTLLDREEGEALLLPQAADLALSIARRGHPIGVLLTVYHTANDQVWSYFSTLVEQIPDDGPDRTATLTLLYGRAGRWVNGTIEKLVTVYVAEREAAVQGTLARRSETVQALLRGDPADVDTASRELTHSLRGQQTGFVLWLDEAPGQRSATLLDAVAQAVARRLGAPPPLTLPAGRRDLWFWLSTHDAPDLGLLPEVIAGATERLPGARLAVGRTAPGVEGFRASHREALAAQRIAVDDTSAAALDSALVTYADVELVSLLAGSPEGADALTAHELRGLADPDAGLDRVRETLAAYLRRGGNVEQTAADLVIHKNTVRYRLGQAEELVGHPLTERRTELDLALRWLALRPVRRASS